MARNPLTEMVLEFHTAFELHDHTAAEPCVPPAPVCLMRVQALTEELAELMEAALISDLAGVLDALCDLQYFLEGTTIACGLHDSHGMREMEGLSFIHVPLRPGVPDSHELVILSTELAKRLAILARAMGCGEVQEVHYQLSDFRSQLNYTWVVFGLLGLRDLAMREVHRTNMAKLHDGRVVRDGSGRVVKPVGWEPPDLAQFFKAPT